MAIRPKRVGEDSLPSTLANNLKDFLDSDRLSYDQAGSRGELAAKARAFPKKRPSGALENIRFADQGFRLHGQDEKESAGTRLPPEGAADTSGESKQIARKREQKVKHLR